MALAITRFLFDWITPDIDTPSSRTVRIPAESDSSRIITVQPSSRTVRV